MASRKPNPYYFNVNIVDATRDDYERRPSLRLQLDAHPREQNSDEYYALRDSMRDLGVLTWVNPDMPYFGLITLSYLSRFSANLNDVEVMHKTLKSAAAKQAKFSEQDGPARSYGHALARIARSVGIDSFRIEASKEHLDMTGERYKFLNIGDFVAWIDRYIDEWKAGLNIDKAA